RTSGSEGTCALTGAVFFLDAVGCFAAAAAAVISASVLATGIAKTWSKRSGPGRFLLGLDGMVVVLGAVLGLLSMVALLFWCFGQSLLLVRCICTMLMPVE
ncbi:hypothetical protein F4804DRAFT_311180, partial [Jackrogersella minutella]